MKRHQQRLSLPTKFGCRSWFAAKTIEINLQTIPARLIKYSIIQLCVWRLTKKGKLCNRYRKVLWSLLAEVCSCETQQLVRLLRGYPKWIVSTSRVVSIGYYSVSYYPVSAIGSKEDARMINWYGGLLKSISVCGIHRLNHTSRMMRHAILANCKSKKCSFWWSK